MNCHCEKRKKKIYQHKSNREHNTSKTEGRRLVKSKHKCTGVRGLEGRNTEEVGQVELAHRRGGDTQNRAPDERRHAPPY